MPIIATETPEAVDPVVVGNDSHN